MKKLSMAVAVSVALGFASNAFAAGEDVLGDSLISLPKYASTVETKVVDVYFLAVKDALGYTVIMNGDSESASTDYTKACAAATATNYKKSMVLAAENVDCGQETTTTKPGDSTIAGAHLCKWTTPELADGYYSIAINPILALASADTAVDIEDTAVAANNCSKDGGTTAKNDATGYSAGSIEASDVIAAGTAKNANYQVFKVDAAVDTPDTPITAAPMTPEPLLPAAGKSLASDASGKLTFTDVSPAEKYASWYELWIFDKDNNRVTDFDANLTYPNWFKEGVDTSELVCSPTSSGGRSCEITLGTTSTKISTDADAADIFTWWVRGFNEKGLSSWSSAPGTFVK